MSEHWWADVEGPSLPQAWTEILGEVEAEFEITGAQTPGWDDPHDRLPEGQDSPEDWYSRVTEPGRYRIVWARAHAWMRVILRHCWARAEEVPGKVARITVRWAGEGPIAPDRVTILHPVIAHTGAQALVLAELDETGQDNDEGRCPTLIIGVGQPVAIPFLGIPDCGCDACDSGSDDLIEQVDQYIIPILDGSYRAYVRPLETWTETPFYGGGSDWSAASRSVRRQAERDDTVPVEITAGPWFADWQPLPM